MNKRSLYYFIAVVLVGAIPSTTYILRNKVSGSPQQPQVCTQEAKICPNGTSVGRTGPHCEFTPCPITTTSTSSLEVTTSSSTPLATTSVVMQPLPTNNTPHQESIPPTTLSKISSVVSSIINTVTSPFKNTTPSVVTYTNQPISPSTYVSSSSTSVYKPTPPEKFAGEKFVVKDGNIFTSDNRIVYSIPQNVISAVGSSNPGWTNTTINVIQIGTVAPILNAIPIKDLPGKYYLSENSFGNLENCEFSNKIFILDTVNNSVQLMYEENSNTLSHDDPRACNSEIFLLNTEGPNLILKYHTIQTNTQCDSAWSEPEKTFYLDVTKLRTEGMRRYVIPEALSAGAEAEEEACRAGL